MSEELATVNDNANLNIPTGYICTVDISKEEGKITVARALNGSEPLKNYTDKVLKLKSIITTPGVRSVSGTDCTNSYMVLEDGKVLFSQSDGVARSLKVITGLWGDVLAEGKTVNVKCISQTLNNGNTLKTIVPA